MHGSAPSTIRTEERSFNSGEGPQFETGKKLFEI